MRAREASLAASRSSLPIWPDIKEDRDDDDKKHDELSERLRSRTKAARAPSHR
jgi:hypothetical protein